MKLNKSKGLSLVGAALLGMSLVGPAVAQESVTVSAEIETVLELTIDSGAVEFGTVDALGTAQESDVKATPSTYTGGAYWVSNDTVTGTVVSTGTGVPTVTSTIAGDTDGLLTWMPGDVTEDEITSVGTDFGDAARTLATVDAVTQSFTDSYILDVANDQDDLTVNATVTYTVGLE